MDWFVLGIEPTKDKKAITAAYREKLRHTNPEDKPDEFKALRVAYEDALAYADQNDADTMHDTSPIGIWMEAISALYQNYAARIDPSQWRTLLQDDVCVAIDTHPAAEDALLKFLMENFYLPKPVWAVLDDVFHFSQRVDELYESYPREFIDQAIMNGLRLDPALAYELFCPGVNGADCDSYRRLYFQACQMAIADLEPVLAQLDALSERHPYGEALRFRFLLETGKTESGKEGLCKLAQDHPNNAHLTLLWAAVCLEDEQTAEAESLCKQILEREPAHMSAKNTLAQCLAKQGHYHEAKELLYELTHSCGNDPVLMTQFIQQMKQWNEQLIAQREAHFASCPEDTDNAIELAWCYAQNERVDDAVDLALQIDSKQADPYAYHNLMGKLNHNVENFREALIHLQKLDQLIRNMTPDGTKETEKRIKRLPEILQLQGNCLMQLQETDAARMKFEEALEIAPNDPDVLSLMGKILLSTGDYDYAVEILERLIRVTPNAWHAELLLSLTLYRLHRDKDAYDAINRALSIQSNDLSLYTVKMQILIRNGVWDEVHAILDFLKESGAPDDISIDYVHAQLAELELNDTQQAFAQYQKIARRVEGGEILIWASELYYRMAVLMSQWMNMNDAEDREILIAQIDKGLSHNDQDANCLTYKARILKQGGQIDRAIEMYRNLEAKNPHSVAALRGLAELYYDNLNLHAQKALHYYERLLETQKTAELYFYAATCNRFLGNWDSARKYYLMELELDPDDIDGYRGLALICDTQGKYEESLELLNQAIAIMESYEHAHMWLLEHKVQVLRRMGQYENALSFVDEIMQRYQYDAGFQLQFDICCQFGLWDRASRVLDDWKRANRNAPDLMAATGKLHLLTGKMFKAAVAMGPAKHKLPFEQIQDFRLQLASLECNHRRQVQIWSRRVQQDPSDDYAMTNLAEAFWYCGQKEASRQAAQKALVLLDQVLTQNLTEEALYRSRRCAVLAILGRADEARAELETVRSLPLCQHCEYGKCKDADIYEASIEEILGNTEKALQLYRSGMANWPDDTDFAAGEARLKRKGK